MAIQNLLDRMVGVRTIDRTVPLEIEPTRILMEEQRSPVLFKDLNGRMAAGNLWSDRDRVTDALGLKKGGLTKALLQALASPRPVEEVKKAGFEDIVKEKFDLMDLPIPKYFPEDGGRYVTAGVAIAEFEGKLNISFHRLMLMEGNKFAIRLVPRHLFTMHKLAKEKGEELKVAFVIGTCPSVLLAGATSTDFEMNELEIASALRFIGLKEGLKVRRTKTGIPVPADADYVLEGRLTSEMVDEGPFVDITGTYDIVRTQPVFQVDRLYQRKDAVLHLILPGGLEHYLLMGLPREPVIFKTVRQVVPRIHAVRLTEGGCCWLNGVISITKNKEGDAMNAAMAAFTGHPSMKQVIVVDQDIDIYDDRQVEWAVASRFQASRGLLVINNAAGSSLDPSAEGTTSKLAIDATKPLGDTKAFDKATLP
ncbi:MAG TPA: UbiD family decarboxylase [Methanomassiliicoccales archaeon]|nr:UbiD family decarboxylase [Methanomassiliicoccales archaeon]